MTAAIQQPDAHRAFREANHRFLHILTALDRLLRTDFGHFADPAVREAAGVFSSRIHAFARAHRTLGEAPAEALVDVRAHLACLCAELCAAHLAPRGVHCEFKADSGVLPRETCQKLSLIVVELITNAARHAFDGRPWGRVRVSLRRVGPVWICQVADNGCGLRSDRRGDGMKLVQRLTRTLDGDLHVHSDAGGVIVSVTLPTDPALAATVVAGSGRAPCAA